MLLPVDAMKHTRPSDKYNNALIMYHWMWGKKMRSTLAIYVYTAQAHTQLLQTEANLPQLVKSSRVKVF